MGRELPPAEVLAADQRITARARQLKKAGLDGDMDVLRARAYLDLLLGQDSRPGQPAPGGQDGTRSDGPGGPGSGGPGPAGPGNPAAGPAAGAVPGGFAGRVTVTVPLATLLGLAGRPGEIPGIGPVDPTLARDLAAAAARNPRSTWCVTVTDRDGHAIGHGCARPGPGNPRERGGRRKPGPPDGRDPPRGTSGTSGPGFSFTASGQPGPSGGYGTWTLRTGGDGPDLTVTLDPIATGDCDHPRSKQDEQGDRERWPWLPGTIVEQCGPDEWYVCIEVRDLAVLRDGRRAPRGTASRNLYYPCCFRDSSEIRSRPASGGPAAARRGTSW